MGIGATGTWEGIYGDSQVPQNPLMAAAPTPPRTRRAPSREERRITQKLESVRDNLGMRAPPPPPRRNLSKMITSDRALQSSPERKVELMTLEAPRQPLPPSDSTQGRKAPPLPPAQSRPRGPPPGPPPRDTRKTKSIRPIDPLASSRQKRSTLKPPAMQQRHKLKSIVDVSRPKKTDEVLNYDEDGNVVRDTMFYAQTPNALSMSTMGQLNDNLKNLIKKRGEDEEEV